MAGPICPVRSREWNGDSRARWEGDALVIDSSNFRDVNSLGSATGTLYVVERLTRVDERSLRYEFSVSDPAAFKRPWSGAYTLRRSESRMFEFACHEGNYSIVGVLRGARALDK